MNTPTNYTFLVEMANKTFPGYGITEIITGFEGFDDPNEVATTSMYELPLEVREWIVKIVKSYLTIGEGIYNETINEGTRVILKGSVGGYYCSGQILDIMSGGMVRVLWDDKRTSSIPISELAPPSRTAPINF